jgi:Transport and Golgi organisation 2
MCTVTFVPSSSGYYLTSNRDEKNTRAKALPPIVYNLNGISLIFPKDGDAGGTWIVLKENGDSLCLLNGAFVNFIDTGTYKISRGKIVTEIAIATNLIHAFQEISLIEVAPFTLIVVNEKKLFECRWDGERKHCKALDYFITHIWSSATLYDNEQQAKRKYWFEQWQKENVQPLQKDLFHFHTNSGDGNVEDNLVMNRNDKYFTVSITGIAVNDKKYLMHYQDLIHNEYNTTSFAYERANS